MKKNIIIILSLIALNACVEATLQPFPQNDVRPLDFPMKVGNEWVYDISDADGEIIDEMKMSFSSNKELAIDSSAPDSSVNCFFYEEQYTKFRDRSAQNGEMYMKENKLYSSLNLRSHANKKEHIVLAHYPLTVGKEWHKVIFEKLPGQMPIKEVRRVTRQFDTTFAGNTFRQCSEIEICWTYQKGPQKDEFKIGRYILSPKIGIIYEERSLDGNIIEKKKH